MPRRKDNEIYSYKLKSGKTKYGFKTYLGIDRETGKSIKITRQGFDSRKMAEQVKIQMKASGATNEQKAKHQQNHGRTLADVWQEWLPIYRTSVKGATINRTKDLWKNHLEPEFGNSYVNHILPDHIQHYAEKEAHKYVAFRKSISLLKRLIKFAIVKGWAKSNPFDRVVLPKKSDQSGRLTTGKYLEADQVKQLMQIIKKGSYRTYTYFELLANLGLRRGEGLGLKWSDVNWQDKTIHIQRTVTVNEDGHKAIGTPKTFSSNRVLPLSDNLITILQKYKSLHKYDTDQDYLFHTATGSFINPSDPTVWLEKIYKKHSELHHVISPHGLRHTMASLLYEGNSNITPKDVQYLLGHKHVDTALQIYTHVTKQQKKNIKNSINNLNI